MDQQALLERFRALAVWRRGDQRAPHKPLLLLYMLGRYQQGAARLIPFQQINEALTGLLREFGPPRQAYHPEYPFWRLQNDGVWEVVTEAPLTPRASNSDPLKSELLRFNVPGGLTAEIYQCLQYDQGLQRQLVELLLAEHFPRSLHADILEAVGLAPALVLREASTRDARFRAWVLAAYEHRCALCGFDLRLGPHPLALEAAHIKWHQAGGPDEVPNGLALCVMHHALFDRGAWTLAGGAVRVAPAVHGSRGLDEWLLRYAGEAIHTPREERFMAAPQYLDWHQREVFRG